VEAKEGVQIQAENQTLASITFQNYFRLYGKLAGMTGTADTEAYEFQEIYGLETVVIPPNKPPKREDQLDRVYKTTQGKYDAAIADIRECHERGQPVLVGTTSIENSEIISELLTKAKLPHQVLNAKQHAREADIVAQAGRPDDHHRHQHGRPRHRHRAGRQRREASTRCSEDDQPGRCGQRRARRRAAREWQKDHEQVKALGGLRIIATERHESRRIDNQLRGRSGRQGDPAPRAST
jgi:preprotein translocase subunit SecA